MWEAWYMGGGGKQIGPPPFSTGSSWRVPGESCVSMKLIKSVLGWQAAGDPSRNCARGPSSTKPAVWDGGGGSSHRGEHHQVVCLRAAITGISSSLSKEPPTSLHDYMYINPTAHLMTHTRPRDPTCQRAQLAGYETVKESSHTSYPILLLRLLIDLSEQKHTHRSYLCNNEEVVPRVSLHHYLLSVLKLNWLQSISHSQTFPLIQRLCEQQNNVLFSRMNATVDAQMFDVFVCVPRSERMSLAQVQ